MNMNINNNNSICGTPSTDHLKEESRQLVAMTTEGASLLPSPVRSATHRHVVVPDNHNPSDSTDQSSPWQAPQVSVAVTTSQQQSRSSSVEDVLDMDTSMVPESETQLEPTLQQQPSYSSETFNNVSNASAASLLVVGQQQLHADHLMGMPSSKTRRKRNHEEENYPFTKRSRIDPPSHRIDNSDIAGAETLLELQSPRRPKRKMATFLPGGSPDPPGVRSEHSQSNRRQKPTVVQGEVSKRDQGDPVQHSSVFRQSALKVSSCPPNSATGTRTCPFCRNLRFKWFFSNSQWRKKEIGTCFSCTMESSTETQLSQSMLESWDIEKKWRVDGFLVELLEAGYQIPVRARRSETDWELQLLSSDRRGGVFLLKVHVEHSAIESQLTSPFVRQLEKSYVKNNVKDDIRWRNVRSLGFASKLVGACIVLSVAPAAKGFWGLSVQFNGTTGRFEVFCLEGWIPNHFVEQAHRWRNNDCFVRPLKIRSGIDAKLAAGISRDFVPAADKRDNALVRTPDDLQYLKKAFLDLLFHLQSSPDIQFSPDFQDLDGKLSTVVVSSGTYEDSICKLIKESMPALKIRKRNLGTVNLEGVITELRQPARAQGVVSLEAGVVLVGGANQYVSILLKQGLFIDPKLVQPLLLDVTSARDLTFTRLLKFEFECPTEDETTASAGPALTQEARIPQKVDTSGTQRAMIVPVNGDVEGATASGLAPNVENGQIQPHNVDGRSDLVEVFVEAMKQQNLAVVGVVKAQQETALNTSRREGIEKLIEEVQAKQEAWMGLQNLIVWFTIAVFLAEAWKFGSPDYSDWQFSPYCPVEMKPDSSWIRKYFGSQPSQIACTFQHYTVAGATLAFVFFLQYLVGHESVMGTILWVCYFVGYATIYDTRILQNFKNKVRWAVAVSCFGAILGFWFLRRVSWMYEEVINDLYDISASLERNDLHMETFNMSEFRRSFAKTMKSHENKLRCIAAVLCFGMFLFALNCEGFVLNTAAWMHFISDLGGRHGIMGWAKYANLQEIISRD